MVYNGGTKASLGLFIVAFRMLAKKVNRSLLCCSNYKKVKQGNTQTANKLSYCSYPKGFHTFWGIFQEDFCGVIILIVTTIKEILIKVMLN